MSLSVKIFKALPSFELDVSFEVEGGVTALFGPSGAGKTTIVKAVAGITAPDAGVIKIAGQTVYDETRKVNLPAQKRAVGYVFQEPRLFPHMTVRSNLLFGAKSRGHVRDEPQFQAICDLLGLQDLLTRHPNALSGGEQQRVALGRALLSKPRLLLLDEPLSALDSARKAEILPYLERLRDDLNIPMLYVSHSVSEVARLATNVALIKDGRLMRFGPCSEVFADPSAASHIGLKDAGAVITARVQAHAEDGLTSLAAAGTQFYMPRLNRDLGTKLRLRIKASDVMLALRAPQDISALNIAKGTISEIREGNGPGVLVQLACGDAHLLARLTRRSAKALGLSVGQDVYAIIKSVSVAQSDIGT